MTKYIPVFIAVAISIGLYLGLQYSGERGAEIELFGRKNSPLPPFNMPTLAEGNMSEKNLLTGVSFILNIWATWCVSCHLEHPFLLELQRQGMNIVGLNYMDNADKAQQWLLDLGNPYAVVIKDTTGRYGIELGVTGAPETYLIDENGIIVYKHRGVLNKENWQIFCHYLRNSESAVPACL